MLSQTKDFFPAICSTQFATTSDIVLPLCHAFPEKVSTHFHFNDFVITSLIYEPFLFVTLTDVVHVYSWKTYISLGHSNITCELFADGTKFYYAQQFINLISILCEL